MLTYQPDQKFLPIEHAIPWQINDSKFVKRHIKYRDLYQKQLKFNNLELAYLEQIFNHHILERIDELNKENKYVPEMGRFVFIDAWEQRTKKWEFDNETDYDFGFTSWERFRCYKPIDVPRFEVHIISLDFNYHYPLYIPADIILGAVIDCIVKNPTYDYKIYNYKYILSEEILQQRLDELYERDIDFRILVVENRKSNNKIFGYQFYHIIPPLSHFPKIYDFSTSISQKRVNPHSSNFAFFPSKPINQTSSPKTKQSNDNKK